MILLPARTPQRPLGLSAPLDDVVGSTYGECNCGFGLPPVVEALEIAVEEALLQR